MLTVVITSMPALQDLDDVLPALLVAARAGDVGVGQLVDQRHLGMAGEHGVEVHLLEAGSPVLDDFAGDDLEAVDQLLGERATVALDEADDDVGAPPLPAVTFVEHGVGLAHPGGGPQVDAEMAGRLDDVSRHRRPPAPCRSIPRQSLSRVAPSRSLTRPDLRGQPSLLVGELKSGRRGFQTTSRPARPFWRCPRPVQRGTDHQARDAATRRGRAGRWSPAPSSNTAVA